MSFWKSWGLIWFDRQNFSVWTYDVRKRKRISPDSFSFARHETYVTYVHPPPFIRGQCEPLVKIGK